MDVLAACSHCDLYGSFTTQLTTVYTVLVVVVVLLMQVTTALFAYEKDIIDFYV